MMICKEAKECKVLAHICDHKTPHEHDERSCKAGIWCREGMGASKCIQFKDEAKQDKIIAASKEEPVIQKLEELADQTAKKDAGKLRYDLIPGELLTNTSWSETFCDIYPGLLTIEMLDNIISDCVSILGSWDNFLRELAKVYTFGCQKYSERSWQTVPNGRTRYEAGMFRHIDAFKRGEYVNWEDGGVLHISQVAFNALAVKWFILQEE